MRSAIKQEHLEGIYKLCQRYVRTYGRSYRKNKLVLVYKVLLSSSRIYKFNLSEVTKDDIRSLKSFIDAAIDEVGGYYD